MPLRTVMLPRRSARAAAPAGRTRPARVRRSGRAARAPGRSRSRGARQREHRSTARWPRQPPGIPRETPVQGRSHQPACAARQLKPRQRPLTPQWPQGPAVVAAQITVGQRPLRTPHLHEVRVREDVEQAAARRLRKCFEVAAPNILRAARVPPDVIALVVDRHITEEVNRADDVVELAAVDQRSPAYDPHDPARNRSSKPSRRSVLLADERAVGVEIVDRLLAPVRMVPDAERLSGSDTRALRRRARQRRPPVAATR